MRHISGVPGASLPSKRGESGDRGRVTFMRNKYLNPINIWMSFDYKIIGTEVVNKNFRCQYYLDYITPEYGDYMIDADESTSYVYIIRGYDSSSNLCSVELLDTLSLSGEESIDDFSLYISPISLTYSYFDKSKIYESATISSLSSKSDETSGLSFNIIAPTTLGDYKVTIEFYNKNISPRMFGVLSTMWGNAASTQIYYIDQETCARCGSCTNPSVCSYGAIKNVSGRYIIDTTKCTGCSNCVGVCPVEAIKLGYIGEDWDYNFNMLKFTSNTNRGALTRYDMDTTRFDNEKLDNFEITIKDWTEGVGDKSFIKQIGIPREAFLKATFYGNYYKYLKFVENPTYYSYWNMPSSDAYEYNAKVYMYTKKSDESIVKKFVGEFTIDEDTFNSNFDLLTPSN